MNIRIYEYKPVSFVQDLLRTEHMKLKQVAYESEFLTSDDKVYTILRECDGHWSSIGACHSHASYIIDSSASGRLKEIMP